jgi:hypothetical protein
LIASVQTKDVDASRGSRDVLYMFSKYQIVLGHASRPLCSPGIQPQRLLFCTAHLGTADIDSSKPLSLHRFPRCAAAPSTIPPRAAILGSPCHNRAASFPISLVVHIDKLIRRSSHLHTAALSAMAALRIARLSRWCKDRGAATR